MTETRERSAHAPAAASEEIVIPDFESPSCAGTDPEIFFPQSAQALRIEAKEARARSFKPFQFYPGKSINPTTAAKAICEGCIHRQDCRDFAINNNIRYGIWGGTTEMERRRLKKLMYDE